MPLNGTCAALARQLRADVASWRVCLAIGMPRQRTGLVGLLNKAAGPGYFSLMYTYH